jgi:hypothetical protein
MRNDAPSVTLRCMRNPKKIHPTNSKNQRRPLATRRPLPSRSRKRLHKTNQKRAGAPRLSQEVQEHAAQADAEVLTRPSETVLQILDSATVPGSGQTVRPSEVDDRENLGNRTEIVEQRRRVLPSSAAFTNGVSAISMEWFNLMRRCTERSLGAMQIFIRCRTPGEFFTAQSNLLLGNLNDAFEGVNRILRQTAGDQRDSLADQKMPKLGD